MMVMMCVNPCFTSRATHELVLVYTPKSIGGQRVAASFASVGSSFEPSCRGLRGQHFRESGRHLIRRHYFSSWQHLGAPPALQQLRDRNPDGDRG